MNVRVVNLGEQNRIYLRRKECELDMVTIPRKKKEDMVTISLLFNSTSTNSSETCRETQMLKLNSTAGNPARRSLPSSPHHGAGKRVASTSTAGEEGNHAAATHRRLERKRGRG